MELVNLCTAYKMKEYANYICHQSPLSWNLYYVRCNTIGDKTVAVGKINSGELTDKYQPGPPQP